MQRHNRDDTTSCVEGICMDTARGFDGGRPYDSDPAEGGVGEATQVIGTD